MYGQLLGRVLVASMVCCEEWHEPLKKVGKQILVELEGEQEEGKQVTF